MSLNELRSFIKDKSLEYPHLKDEFYDLYSLCLSEIEEGGSERHEIELCINDIEETIKEN
jgi:hypothetical protein